MAVPLTVIIALSMVKDAYEDYKRHQNDNVENYSKCLIFDKASKTFKENKWCEIRCGNIVKV